MFLLRFPLKVGTVTKNWALFSFLLLCVGEFISGSAVSEETGERGESPLSVFLAEANTFAQPRLSSSALLRPPACVGHSLRIVNQWAKELGFLPLAHASRWPSFPCSNSSASWAPLDHCACGLVVAPRQCAASRRDRCLRLRTP